MLLLHDSLDGATVTYIGLLRLQASAEGAHAAFSLVHSLLKRLVLPSKDVVTVLAEARGVTSAENKWLRTISRPVGFVVEVTGVPNDLWSVSHAILKGLKFNIPRA